ncbi:MAG: GNAT family N-acetyltransferase [Gammaproteobacteria bacterium]|nr:GNAT family N-acetyltransferase [Gammaproteobacteria bacterium]
MDICYATSEPPGVDEFIDVLERSTLAARRPVENRACLQGMLDHADLFVTARCDSKLVGIARSVTDFHYCCYLSDIAVDREYQSRGIGKQLIRETRSPLGPQCKLILLSAPEVADYYPKIGFTHHPRAWLLDGGAIF